MVHLESPTRTVKRQDFAVTSPIERQNRLSSTLEQPPRAKNGTSSSPITAEPSPKPHRITRAEIMNTNTFERISMQAPQSPSFISDKERLALQPKGFQAEIAKDKAQKEERRVARGSVRAEVRTRLQGWSESNTAASERMEAKKYDILRRQKERYDNAIANSRRPAKE
ncbi:hypothetical protein J8273_2532 [Carpediemonas membranifera]|uniref:Uncharacterized protein n=1 Tax=Carpediemonas membranifera TaxID=201153 RepID=A0A8J6B138_9EUKA|nr:hypothetical protein J8273_2532 [Carpediemonas membranifera]|eukprot:KAG9396180.1 hypothetical protein J8273_2532 [Carpediemonas membranifera]